MARYENQETTIFVSIEEMRVRTARFSRRKPTGNLFAGLLYRKKP
jgi:hypothetical protein